MIGMVLAAGAGRRLAPYTDTLPKTLVPVDGDRTILDIALANLKAAGLDDVAVVTGYAAGAVEERKAALEERHGVTLELVFNDRADHSEYALFQISALSLKTSSSVTPWRSSSAALRSATACAA